ncbi:unnamed protein product [Nyctereutes procyonoides]|uniref:(raccoon dog) hypothetical protein n=1 Tax=Nyctereutes procyonoides TaxID=34880 RepID=A0A811YBJ4_NYCPR|nr:unnamed protein product [Nyctereutes procyonoides]
MLFGFICMLLLCFCFHRSKSGQRLPFPYCIHLAPLPRGVETRSHRSELPTGTWAVT